MSVYTVLFERPFEVVSAWYRDFFACFTDVWVVATRNFAPLSVGACLPALPNLIFWAFDVLRCAVFTLIRIVRADALVKIVSTFTRRRQELILNRPLPIAALPLQCSPIVITAIVRTGFAGGALAALHHAIAIIPPIIIDANLLLGAEPVLATTDLTARAFFAPCGAVRPTCAACAKGCQKEN